MREEDVTPGTPASERTYARDDLALLEAAFAALQQGVTVHDATGRIVACNPAAARLFGLTVDEVLGASSAFRSALDVRYMDDAPVTAENSKVTHVLATGEAQRGCMLQFRSPHEADPRWVRSNFHPLMRDGDATPWGVVCSFVDVTEVETAAARLHDFSRQLRTVLVDESAVVYVKDREGRYLYANRRLGQLFGVPRREVIGRTQAEILPDELDRECDRSTAAALEDQRVVQAEETFTIGGERRTYLTVKFPLLDDTDEPWAIAGVSIDVTERQVAQPAFYDGLTGVANRALLAEHLAQALARAQRHELSVALVLFQVDAGDEGLRAVAQRVQDSVRRTDIVARLGDDEFVLLLSDLPGDPAAAVDSAIRHVEDACRDMSVSFGVSVYPRDGISVEDLLDHADASIYEMQRGRRAEPEPATAPDPPSSESDRLAAAAAIAPVLADLAVLTEVAARQRLTVVLGPEPPGWSVSLVGRDDQVPFLRARGATVAQALRDIMDELARLSYEP